ncbi:hypothetical protein [Paraburkholderia sp.]|uniref:hypothetical protein n=1 Tax=Paraburkholderia sp. TaxID=1926495 RepID=UPI0039E31AEA
MSALLHIEEARAIENLAAGGYDIQALSYRHAGGAGVFGALTAPTIHSVAPGEMMPPEPMMTLTHRGAQALLDALYKAGLRPSSGEVSSGHAAEVAAIRAHLDDMRKLAFHAFESQGPDSPMPLNLEKMVI